MPPVGPHTVLYVEDNTANFRLIELALAHRPGSRLVAALHGRLRLDLAAQHLPDLVLLDLCMPHPDGFEVMRRLAPRVPAGHPLPVLVLTADMAYGTRRRALESGATDFLTKPFDVVEVALQVRNLLQVRFLARGRRGGQAVVGRGPVPGAAGRPRPSPSPTTSGGRGVPAAGGRRPAARPVAGARPGGARRGRVRRGGLSRAGLPVAATAGTMRPEVK